MPPQESVAEDFVSHLFGDFRVEFGRGTAAAAFRQTPENIHIESMLDFATCYAPAHKTDPIEDCDVYIAWGTASSTPSSMLSDYAAHFRKPYLTMEYGLVSSVGLPSSQAAQHAIILSQGPAFCDSTRPTAMEDRLNSPLVFDDGQIARARDCIAKIVAHQITRHNHAPIIDMSQRLRNTGRPRILVVDQPIGEKSVELGLADADTFRRMLERALAMQDHDILVMLCPPSDPQLGGSHLAEVLDEFPSDRMEIIDYDVNAFSLFGLVDKVFVATSLVGLEACFAGREVYCFAVPFYAGWGFTRDMVVTPRRHVSRSLEEVFVTYYLTFSRYHVPGSQVHELEQLIDHIVALRSAGRPVAGATDVIQQAPRIVMVVPSHRMGASGRYMQNLGEALVRVWQ